MKLYKSLILAVLVCFSFDAQSQTFPVDVAIRAELSTPLPWILGSTNELRLVVENRSNRDTRGTIRVQPLSNGPTDVFKFISDSCRRNADCEQFGTLCYDTPIILAGAETQCVLTRQPIQIGQQNRFTRYTYRDLIAPHFDPDLTNNSVDVRITLVAQPPTQVPLSPMSYGLMGLMVLGLGGWAVRRT